jgi:putative DNA primase/helicase
MEVGSSNTAEILKIGKGRTHFEVDPEKGVFYVQTPDNEENEEIKNPRRDLICPPLYVEARTRNSQSDAWGYHLRWKDPDKKWHTWACPADLLIRNGEEVVKYLGRGGLSVKPGLESQKLLCRYIHQAEPKNRVLNVESVGWQEVEGVQGGLVQSFVLPDANIGPELKEAVVVQSRLGGLEEVFRTAGSADDWRKNVGSLCCGNTRLVLAVSAAFAGPLLKHTDVDSTGLHLHQVSSTGKTTAGIVAGSVWGGGPKGYHRTWRTTGNALENTAIQHNDGFLVLDELAQLDPKEAEYVAYMLCNGQGKGRATQTMGVAPQNAWRLMFLSTGEVTFSQHAGRAGHRLKAGTEVRVINIDADAGAGMGVFEDIHGASSAAAFADQLKSAAGRYYGTPIRTFLENLVIDLPGRTAEVRSIIDAFVSEYVPPGSSGEIIRVARKFGLIAAAGELATKFGITSWVQSEAREAAAKCFRSWLGGRETNGSSDVEKAVAQVRWYLQTYGESRFEDAGDSTGRMVNERMGFRKTVQTLTREGMQYQVVEYWIFSESFDKICDGFSPKIVAKALKEKGHLETEPNHNKIKRNLPGIGSNRVYVIKGTILQEDPNEKPDAPGVSPTRSLIGIQERLDSGQTKKVA